jgi:hypothetical protein
MPEDYIMRLLRQISAALAGAMAKKGAGHFAEAAREVDSLFIQTIGLDLARLKQLSPEAVAQLVAATGAMRHLKAVMLAELLLLDAELAESAVGNVSPTVNYVHAFCLLADSFPALTAEEQAVYRPKLIFLLGRLGDLRNHPYIQPKIRDFGTGDAT